MRETDMSKAYREHGVKVPAWLLLEWLDDPERKSAITAFTHSPLRELAYRIESLLREAGEDAQRMQALLSTLDGKSASYMPRVCDRHDPNIGFTKEGLKRSLDRFISDQADLEK